MACKPIAPVIPVSSSIVNKASIAGCLMVFEANTLIIAATPIPLSAPNVVPSARTQSPSTIILIPSVSKLKLVSEFFWCTISKCDCNTTVLRFSMPFEAGFLIITFPTGSTIVSRFNFFPKSTINCITFSSFLEPLGTAFKSAKLFQSSVGSRALISFVIFLLFEFL